MDWQAEVIRLHEVFEAWFRGSAEPNASEMFAGTLDPRFVIVTPDGAVVPRAELVANIKRRNGTSPDLEIDVGDFATVLDVTDGDGDRFVVGRYCECHRRPGAAPARRIATAVLRQAGTDGEWSWLSVHETWSPQPG